MKIIYSCLIILTFLSSCTDAESVQEHAPASHYKEAGEMPFYANNPYDNVGRIHDELFEAYFDGSVLPQSVSDIIARVETVANYNNSFTALNVSGHSPISAERIDYIVGKGNNAISEILNSSSLTSDAKTSFSGFVNSIVILFDTETDAAKLYNAIVKYEATVINDTHFTQNDKRIILTTTSIARHTAYMAKKRPKRNTDPDWIIFVGNVMAAAEGAEEKSSKAIVFALATGIVSNK